MGFQDAKLAQRFSPEKLAKTNLFETAQMFCDVYGLEPGQSQKPHAHATATKFYFVLEGRGVFQIGAERRELGPGELAWSAPGEEHGVENRSSERLVLLVAMSPNPN
ncbi:MAG TPA: cupin domain-containing protein [Planctomycetota bacterium]|nr:cupin domain-containing protein [Planctomycetota bacterium]